MFAQRAMLLLPKPLPLGIVNVHLLVSLPLEAGSSGWARPILLTTMFNNIGTSE